MQKHVKTSVWCRFIITIIKFLYSKYEWDVAIFFNLFSACENQKMFKWSIKIFSVVKLGII